MKSSEINKIIREEIANVMREEENKVTALPQDLKMAFANMGFGDDELKSITRLVVAGGGGQSSANVNDLKVAAKLLYKLTYTPLIRTAIKTASTKKS